MSNIESITMRKTRLKLVRKEISIFRTSIDSISKVKTIEPLLNSLIGVKKREI